MSDIIKPRVRIAPSPTGYLHVGTARTALFNYLFAKRFGGKFLLRIEDTDRSRSDPALLEPILSALKWLGLQWDEDIIYQSHRLDRYALEANRLLKSGHAYRCFCTQEELQAAREEAKAKKLPPKYNKKCLNLSQSEVESKTRDGQSSVIRLNISPGETSYDDMVVGKVTRNNNDIEDLIIARSDGSATYNLAVVVDDHEMGITHVIRGNDHISNTFKQIHLYTGLGWELPRFGHVPLILRADKKKVSKRLGDKDVGQYSAEGILPQAMFNYLALLGWSSKTEREIYSPDELIKVFDPDNFNKSNAVFDENKLEAFNKEHIQLMSDHDLATLAAPLLIDAGRTTKQWLETRWDYLKEVVSLLKPRVRRVDDFVGLGGYFFNFEGEYEAKAEAKQFTPEAADRITSLADRFEALDDFTHDKTEACLSSLAEELAIKRGQLIHPTRLAVSGMSVGPGLYDLLVTLTKPIVIERMRQAVTYIHNMSPAG